jgi:hypothetical protein
MLKIIDLTRNEALSALSMGNVIGGTGNWLDDACENAPGPKWFGEPPDEPTMLDLWNDFANAARLPP